MLIARLLPSVWNDSDTIWMIWGRSLLPLSSQKEGTGTWRYWKHSFLDLPQQFGKILTCLECFEESPLLTLLNWWISTPIYYSNNWYFFTKICQQVEDSLLLSCTKFQLNWKTFTTEKFLISLPEALLNFNSILPITEISDCNQNLKWRTLGSSCIDPNQNWVPRSNQSLKLSDKSYLPKRPEND